MILLEIVVIMEIKCNHQETRHPVAFAPFAPLREKNGIIPENPALKTCLTRHFIMSQETCFKGNARVSGAAPKYRAAFRGLRAFVSPCELFQRHFSEGQLISQITFGLAVLHLGVQLDVGLGRT